MILRHGAARPLRRRNPFPKVARDAASESGSMRDWQPKRNRFGGASAYELSILQDRQEDAVQNYWAAGSLVETMNTNITGRGLLPKAKPMTRILGISPEQSREVAQQQQDVFKIWAKHAHVSGKFTFSDLTALNMRTALTYGEAINLPVMFAEECKRPFSFALQDLHPSRLRSPVGMEYAANVHEGIEFTPYGEPLNYYIDNSLARESSSFCGTDYVVRPAKLAHRPNVLHFFQLRSPEQVRGESTLTAVIQLCRQLDTSVNYELAAQIISAAFPILIEREDSNGELRRDAFREDNKGWYAGHQTVEYDSVEPGGLAYLNPGERANVLDSKHPSVNWVNFTEFVMRAIAATSGVPYEVLSKDFSKTNYSSARAALQEAWRVFKRHRQWLADHFCCPVWAMVQEEAILRGYVKLPANAPSFYDAMDAWTHSEWIGEGQGYINPLQEAKAQIALLDAHLATHEGTLAERGQDAHEVLEQIMAEMHTWGVFNDHGELVNRGEMPNA